MTKDDIETQEALDRVGQPTRGEILGGQIPVPTPEQTVALLGAHTTEPILEMYREIIFAVGSNYAADVLKLANEPPSVLVRAYEYFSHRVNSMFHAAYNNGETT